MTDTYTLSRDLIERDELKANRDDWMKTAQEAQQHRDGANAQIAEFEATVRALQTLLHETEDRCMALRAERDALRRALHEIAEEWAGAECGEPVHAQEAYVIGLAKRMYGIAADALRTRSE
jgi:chromosome segregation ATPase